MAQLAEAFKKYEVADLECQMYVACEASQEARHEENGALAKEVFAIMRWVNTAGRKFSSFLLLKRVLNYGVFGNYDDGQKLVISIRE